MANPNPLALGLGIGIAGAGLPYPLIAGFAFSYASVELKFNLPTGLKIYKGVKAINYKAPLEVQKIWGAHIEPIAQTVGKQDYDGDVELYFAEANDLQNTLGGGWSQIFFDTHVTYSTPGYPMISDILRGCRLTSPEGPAIAFGSTEGLTRKYNLNPMSILYGGLSLVQNPLAGTNS